MSQVQTYKLGGYEVYDVNGVPHYAKTKTPVKSNRIDGKIQAPPIIGKVDGSVKATVVPNPDTGFRFGQRVRDSSPESFETIELTEDQKPAPKPETKPEQTRDVDAPDGSGAKGTQMSPKIDLGAANSLLSGLGIGNMADVNSFLSEQLPVSPGEKQGQGKQTSLTNDEFILQAQGAGALDGFKGGTNDEAILYAQNAGFTPTAVVEGSSTPGEIGASPADTADNNRSVSVPGEDPQNSGTNWGVAQPKSFERSRRDAFLDLNNRGYGAIRAADAATGRFRQGDKFFYNVGGELQEVNEDTYRQGQHRQLSAEELKSGFVEAIKPTLVPVDQPDVTSPYQNDSTIQMPEGDAPDLPEGAAPITPATTVDTSTSEFNYNNAPPTYETEVDMKGNYFNKDDEE